MNRYSIKKIDVYKIRTLDDYANAVDNAESVTVKGFQAVVDYIGAKPYKQRCGYACNTGRYDYIVMREG